MKEQDHWVALARRIGEVNQKNGWDLSTYDNVPTKVMMAVTELDEGVQGVKGTGPDPLEIEIADTVIRLLSILEGVWPGQWVLRHGCSPQKGQRFRDIEVLLWPILGFLCRAVESWRFDKREDVQASLECAIAECRSLARLLGFDLFRAMEAKVALNAARGHWHGKAKAAG